MSPQIQRGISLFTPLSLRREVGGEAASSVFQAVFSSLLLLKDNGVSRLLPPSPFGEGTGERLCRGCFRLYEIPLQTVRCYCSQINSLSLKTAFVTYRESISYKEGCKRCPFASQYMPFYTSKDALLHCKRASFTTQKGMYYLPTVNSLYIRWARLCVNKLISQQVHCTIWHTQRHPFTSLSLFFRG